MQAAGSTKPCQRWKAATRQCSLLGTNLLLSISAGLDLPWTSELSSASAETTLQSLAQSSGPDGNILLSGTHPTKSVQQITSVHLLKRRSKAAELIFWPNSGSVRENSTGSSTVHSAVRVLRSLRQVQCCSGVPTTCQLVHLRSRNRLAGSPP